MSKDFETLVSTDASILVDFSNVSLAAFVHVYYIRFLAIFVSETNIENNRKITPCIKNTYMKQFPE